MEEDVQEGTKIMSLVTLFCLEPPVLRTLFELTETPPIPSVFALLLVSLITAQIVASNLAGRKPALIAALLGIAVGFISLLIAK